jgi:hypothetical protein
MISGFRPAVYEICALALHAAQHRDRVQTSETDISLN